MSNDIPVDYQRKTFRAKAYRVTVDNIDTLARQSRGELNEDGEKQDNFSRKYILLDRPEWGHPRKRSEAHVGDWLVQTGHRWSVYNDRAFHNTFEPIKADAPKQHKTRKPPKNAPKPRMNVREERGTFVEAAPGIEALQTDDTSNLEASDIPLRKGTINQAQQGE